MRQLGRSKVLSDRSAKLPDEGVYLWQWWCELDHARGSNGFGPEPLSHREIAEWARLMRVDIDPWEVRALRAIDTGYLSARQGG